MLFIRSCNEMLHKTICSTCQKDCVNEALPILIHENVHVISQIMLNEPQ